MCAHCWKMFHISMRGRLKIATNNTMTFDEAAHDTWKIWNFFSWAKHSFRTIVSVYKFVHAWVLSTHLNNSLVLRISLSLPFAVIAIRCLKSLLVYANSIGLFTYKSIFLYRSDPIHFTSAPVVSIHWSARVIRYTFALVSQSMRGTTRQRPKQNQFAAIQFFRLNNSEDKQSPVRFVGCSSYC